MIDNQPNMKLQTVNDSLSCKIIVKKCVKKSIRALELGSISRLCFVLRFYFFWGFEQYYLHCLWVSQIPFFSHFFIKNGFHSTIHTFKNYFATVFSISVFGFSKNKLNPNGTYVTKIIQIKMKCAHDKIRLKCLKGQLASVSCDSLCIHN